MYLGSGYLKKTLRFKKLLKTWGRVGVYGRVAWSRV